jgi:hypothetical protein
VKFELDFSDGEVRFRTSGPASAGGLTSELIAPLFYGNMSIMDSYLPGLMKVIYSDMSPAHVIAEIETAAGADSVDEERAEEILDASSGNLSEVD